MTLFQEKYNTAPKKIQEVVSSEDTSEILADIALKNGIGDNGLGNPKLGRLVGNTLVGISHPKDFVPSLEKELSISNENAQNIAKEVNKKIFSQAKDELVVMYNLGNIAPPKKEIPPAPDTQTEKDPYNTSADLFEKKLQRSAVLQEKGFSPKTETSIEKSSTPAQSDSYREFVE